MPQSTRISPLRQRLIDDMTIRRLAPRTQVAYIYGVKCFAGRHSRPVSAAECNSDCTRLAPQPLASIHCPPDKATTEDLRLYRLELARSGRSVASINQNISGIRFFYTVTLPSEPMLTVAKYIRQPDQLPVVLSTDEVTRLLACAPNFKYWVMLPLCYSAGLRVSELVSLKVADIDSSRMVVRVEQGKGRKDRYTILSPQVLPMLRQWYVEAGKPRHAPRSVRALPRSWLIPKDPKRRWCDRAAARATGPCG